MQSSTAPHWITNVLGHIDRWSVALGLAAFTTLLFIDLGREHAHPAWIVFDAAMVLFCLGDVVARFTPAPVLGQRTRRVIRDSLTLVSGVVLIIAFSYFAFTAVNGLQVTLAAFIIALGTVMFVPAGKRLRVNLAAITGHGDEQR